jgi:hypothetical protein
MQEVNMAQNTSSFATNFQLWRLNCLGLLRLVDWPDEELEQPLGRGEAKEALAAAQQEGLWQPEPRGERGERQWDSAAS